MTYMKWRAFVRSPLDNAIKILKIPMRMKGVEGGEIVKGTGGYIINEKEA